ncbi:maltodextrin glucosidase, partial [Vibrio parahaemolyticus]|nr:maltodextrin glucosidase [Vibrio parahaemolyticus]
ARAVQKRIPPKQLHLKLNVKHQPPKWVQELFFYQIFPDLFAASQSESAIREAYYEYDPDAESKMWGEPVGTHQITGAREF